MSVVQSTASIETAPIGAGPDAACTMRPTVRQILLADGLGIAFWLSAALLFHVGAPAGAFRGLSLIVIYAATIPATWLIVRRVWRIVRPAPAMRVAAIALVTSTATFCDAAAFAWFPSIYATDPAEALTAATWIFWGVGWALLLSLWPTRR